MTSCVRPETVGRTYAKFHSSPAAQSRRQKPSFISHFAMKIFASSAEVAKAWMRRCKVWPIWSIAPRGAVFCVLSLTEGTVCVANLTGKERSRIVRNCRDLCGIIAIGDIFNSFGGSCLMSSHSTKRACPASIFSLTSSVSWLMASGLSAEECGPLSMAACISVIVQQAPV